MQEVLHIDLSVFLCEMFSNCKNFKVFFLNYKMKKQKRAQWSVFMMFFYFYWLHQPSTIIEEKFVKQLLLDVSKWLNFIWFEVRYRKSHVKKSSFKVSKMVLGETKRMGFCFAETPVPVARFAYKGLCKICLDIYIMCKLFRSWFSIQNVVVITKKLFIIKATSF